MDMNIPFENLSGIFKNILENKQLTFVEKENIAEDDLIARDWIKEGEFDYLLFLPLVIYDELIGILFCHSPKKDMTLTKEKLDKLGRFTELIAGSVFNAQLLKKVENWKESDLDKYVLPHPLLGKISLREMLYFTDFHILHHNTLAKTIYLS